jgi:hypothetical protein
MEKLVAKQAWAVCYDPNQLLDMGEEYDADRLDQLNEYLYQGDYVLVSADTQGYPGDLIVDFPRQARAPYRALILLDKF